MKPKLTIDQHGIKEWKLPSGDLHREDGPACEYSNGSRHWYINGKKHREDGPATEYSDGSKMWYINGVCHREDGPAIEYGDDYKRWFLNGKEYTEQEYKYKTRSIKLNKLLK